MATTAIGNNITGSGSLQWRRYQTGVISLRGCRLDAIGSIPGSSISGISADWLCTHTILNHIATSTISTRPLSTLAADDCRRRCVTRRRIWHGHGGRRWCGGTAWWIGVWVAAMGSLLLWTPARRHHTLARLVVGTRTPG